MPKVEGSGRKSSNDWAEVVKVDGEPTKCKCIHCNSNISCKIERIRTHLNKCYARKGHGLDLRLHQNESASDLRTLSATSPLISSSNTCGVDPSTSNFAASTSKKVQQSMNKFCLKTSDKEKIALDKAVANFFYAANISFNATELDQYKIMMEALRPGYKPPSSKDIGGKLLDNAAEEIDQQLSEKIKNCSLTLTLDGWSNVRNDPIQAITVHTGVESFLLKAIDSGSDKKTAKKCAEVIEAAIQQCQEKFNKGVFAVVTDNENKMTKMWKILKEKNPKLVAYGCSAHLLNLVEKEVSPRSVLKQIVEVQKYFRNVHAAHGWIREKKGVIPQIPNDTRWNSHPDCVKTFVANFHKYREIALENSEHFEKSISRILDNVAIYQEALNMEKQLLVVSNALDILQKDSTSISVAVEVWLDLLSNEILEPYHECFQKRFEQAIQPPHLLANLMDPKIRGQRLSREQECAAEEWLTELHPDYLPGVLAFKINDPEYYPTSLLQDTVVSQFSSAKWWQIMAKKSEKGSPLPPDFCEFFYSLLSAPASSASIERYFSVFGLVWNKLRNRLGVDKATKLVQVYKSLHTSQNS